MAEQTPCPRCQHANPPDNCFCGWCGTPLGTAGRDLVERREGDLTVLDYVRVNKGGFSSV